MNPFSLACLGIAGLIQLVLGLRLLWLSRETRGAPEILWGLTWSLAAVENTLDAVSGAVGSPETKLALRWAVSISYPLVVMMIFFANYRLFRPQARWAGALCGAVVVALIGIWLWQVTVPGLDVMFAGTTRPLDNWANNIGMTVGLSWAAGETLRYYRMYEKRWRIGLAPRLLVFRYLWWFGAAVTMVLFWVVLWLRQAFDLPMWVMDVTLPIASLVGVILMWTTFFPPDWLRSRLDQEAPAP